MRGFNIVPIRSDPMLILLSGNRPLMVILRNTFRLRSLLPVVLSYLYILAIFQTYDANSICGKEKLYMSVSIFEFPCYHVYM